MVRAGKNSIFIEDFERLNIVAIGWGLGDLTNKTSDEIKELVRKHYPKNSNRTNGKIAANEIKFRHEIKKGDYVLSYNSWTHNYLFGKIISDYYFDPNLINEEFSDIRDVEWLCKIPRDDFKKSTRGTLKTQITVFHINENAQKDILSFYQNEDIKQIRTVTLANTNFDSLTYDDAINFLSNVLINERDGHYHYFKKNINLIGRTLVLFKYEGKLIAKGIFCDEAEKQVEINGENYNGYYLTEKDSIEIFKEPIGLTELKNYVPNIISLSRDQIIDLKYLSNVYQMIDEHVGEGKMNDEYELPSCIIKRYLAENNLGDLTDEKTEERLSKFQSMFSPEKLSSFEGSDILYNIFPQKGNNSTLCYNLEFSDDFKWLCGGIRGGASFKFSLFKYAKTGKWTVGSSIKNMKTISEDEAINLATKIRDALVEGAEYIQKNNLESVEDYILFEEKLNNLFKDLHKDCPINPTHSWIHKYYTLIFPDKFLGIHVDWMKKDCIRKFRIEPADGFYATDAQFYQLAKKSGVKLNSLYDERIVKLFFESGNIWNKIEDGKLVELEECDFGEKNLIFKSNKKRNIIYFGAPGTGKSYNLNKDKDDLLKEFKDNYERVTFHPDYSYANFVGTYKPVPENNSITYRYVPGPFMRILKKALNKPDEPFMLIIEEINRANVAAVFGDVFQLLDRDENNESEYAIETSEDMRTYLNKNKIKLPQNLFIWATMNSADQGVFPMDTAFKRRWDFKYFSINHNENLIKNSHVIINDKLLNWNDLRKRINDELLSYNINEDKLIGPFFAFTKSMNEEIEIKTFKDIFKNKIIMYLFEDAARSRRNQLFSGACNIKDTKNITYFELCELIDADKITEIFSNDFLDDEEEDNERDLH